MARDILNEIVERRKDDIKRLGVNFGYELPKERLGGRAVHPFIAKKGVILEIKRASPSKGDIAPNLDPAKTAVLYARAGARAISCLTETNYFKGSLADLMTSASALDSFEAGGLGYESEIPALLRKDFLLTPEEVDVSYLAGADAVLLIARILSSETMTQMAARAEKLGLSVLIEVRELEDLEKLSYVMERGNHKNIVCGVNSRDLKDFSIDLLTPSSMLNSIREIAEDARVTFESGILSPEAASFAGSMGFSAILLGEAVAKNPNLAGEFTQAFNTEEKKSSYALEWIDYSVKLQERRREKSLPFVKICGITRAEDALLAAQNGADFLGFVFYEKSPRNVSADTVRKIITQVRSAGFNGKFVGVIAETTGKNAISAFSLVREGFLDFIQFHACEIPSASNQFFADIPRYAAVNIKCKKDLESLDNLLCLGQPRVLIDAGFGEFPGGSGSRVEDDLIADASKKVKLWLAGGITPLNVGNIIKTFSPELIDLSSGVEVSGKPGIKDEQKLRSLFVAVNEAKG